ncbi:MAG TPA: TonB-dependent receptor [Acidobacteriota bacterium]
MPKVAVLTLAVFMQMAGFLDYSLAQMTLSKVRGTITDQSDARVPGVNITVTDLLTNISRSSISDDLGFFEISDLKPSKYRLKAELPGFKSFVADNLIVESSQVRLLDIKLEIGESTTEITVNAAAAVIERDESKVAATFTGERYHESPIIGMERFNPNLFLMTLPGVQPGTGWLEYKIAGMGGAQIQGAMDGVSTDGTENSINQMEDTEEVKVVTVNNSAEFSRAGYYNMVGKRGTNSFHGEGHYYHSNSALNAREFFAPFKNPSKLHIFGVNAGGPIIKNKTFFFASWNALRDPSTNFFLTSVPTEKMRRGDFSELLPSRVIRDPLTGNPFPGNIIPSNRLNSLSQKAQDKYLPAPNRGGAGALTNNYSFLHPFPFDLLKIDYLTQRVDHKISEKNEIFGRVTQDWAPYVLPRSFPALGWTRTLHAGHVAVSDTHTFSPSLVNSFSFGWVPLNITDGKPVQGFIPLQGDQVVAELGLQGVNPRGLKAAGFPTMSITGYPALSTVAGGIAHKENIFSYGDSVTWVLSKHVLKIGGELRTFSHNDTKVPTTTYGSFSFNGSLSGYGFADFLLGLPFSSARLDPLVNRTYRSNEFGIYLTDTFRVSNNLTLDYGLRWDYFGATTMDDGLQYNWDPQTNNVIIPSDAVGKISPLYPTNTIKVVPGDVVLHPEKGNIVPRFGAAYRINNNLVVRGGYGVFTEFLGAAYYSYDQNVQATGGPFELSETFFNSIVNGQPLFAFPNPFPAGAGTIASQSIRGYPLNGKNGYIQQFNLSVERQIKDIGLRLSYVGTRGRGLNYGLEINKPQASLIPFSAARRPYNPFVSARFIRRDGATDYDGLTFHAIRKVGDFTFDSHWTWSHSLINNLNLEDPYAPRRWNRDAGNPNHRVVVNAMWNLPVGRGEKYLSDAHPVVNGIVGGWKVFLISFFQTGQYFTPSYSGSDPSNTNTFGGLPDRIRDGNLPPGDRTLQRWFDPTAFAVPSPGRYGNSGVNILQGQGRHVHNLTVSKFFPLHERLTLQFQTAITNVFNHPHFDFPASNISVPSAGQIGADVGTFDSSRGGARRIEGRLRVIW